MAQRFSLKPLFSDAQAKLALEQFSIGLDTHQYCEAIQEAFFDYTLLALNEVAIESLEERNRLFVEAQAHLKQASNLLRGQQHPAGPMALKIDKFVKTLQVVVEGRHTPAKEKAMRFVEKNLGRKLKQFWLQQSKLPFGPGSIKSNMGNNVTAFFKLCFEQASKAYPEIDWFAYHDESSINRLISSIR